MNSVRNLEASFSNWFKQFNRQRHYAGGARPRKAHPRLFGRFERDRPAARYVLVWPFPRRELLDALQVVQRGGVYLATQVHQALGQKPLRSSQLTGELKSPLTPREHEVLELLRQGRSYKGIADHLGVSVNTVNNHLRNIRDKLGVHNSIEAINRVFGS